MSCEFVLLAWVSNDFDRLTCGRSYKHLAALCIQRIWRRLHPPVNVLAKDGDDDNHEPPTTTITPLGPPGQNHLHNPKLERTLGCAPVSLLGLLMSLSSMRCSRLCDRCKHTCSERQDRCSGEYRLRSCTWRGQL